MSINPESIEPPDSCSVTKSTEHASDRDVWSERSRAMREAIDPEQTLPIVELTPSPTLNPLVRPFDIYHGQTLVGECTVTTNPSARERYVSSIEVHDGDNNPWHAGENFRGQGFGMATYLALIAQALSEGNFRRLAGPYVAN